MGHKTAGKNNTPLCKGGRGDPAAFQVYDPPGYADPLNKGVILEPPLIRGAGGILP